MNRTERRRLAREPEPTLDLAHAPLLQPKPTHAGAGLVVLARSLNEQGLYELTDGHSVRDDYVDAEELLGSIRVIVRQELERLLGNGEEYLDPTEVQTWSKPKDCEQFEITEPTEVQEWSDPADVETGYTGYSEGVIPIDYR